MVTSPFNIRMTIAPLIGASLIAGGSGLLSSIGSLFGSKSSNDTSKKLLQMQIDAQREANEYNVAAQKEMNAANIASQEKVNQQQLDYASEINALMRQDSKHAISDKRADLMRAGYSTADPNLSGFSAASLSSPALTAPQGVAPQVAPEVTSDMASSYINGRTSMLRSVMDMFSTSADVALKVAQTTKTGAETEGLVKSNAWIDLESDARYLNILENTELLHKQGKLTQNQADSVAQELQTFQTRFDTLKAQLETIQTTNKELGERLNAELQSTLATVTNISSDTDLKKAEKEILDLKYKFDKYKYELAKMGINFDSNSLFDSLARVFAAPGAGNTPSLLINGFKQILSGLVKELSQFFSDAVSGTVSNVVDKAKSFGSKVVSALNPFD